MAIMGWKAFTDSYHRPYMIFADVAQGQSEQTHFEVLRRLAVAMDPKGSFALFPEDGYIRVAFELDQDAKKFAAGVQAQRTAREDGWAGQWAFGYDEKMQKKIEILLEPHKRKAKPRTVKSSAGPPRKLKRRMLPI
jgi:hypothetical protein